MARLGLPLLVFSALIVYGIAKNYNGNEAHEDDHLLIKKTSSGLIRGRKLITPRNVEGFIYLSVPIAEAPIGKLRFKAPVPRKRWEGIRDAQYYTVSCYWNSEHTSYAPTAFDMSEDCIHVNIFTNRNCLTKGGCAVVVYVHGGSYRFGTPLQYQPDFLVDNFNNASRNVVFVSLSFRQSIFGVANFNHKLKLSTDLNCAFRDLIHGVKWVKNEIEEFGGDPNRLTVMGDSGGGSNTKMLSMSPRSKHLINQVIVMSMSSDFVLVRDRNENATRKVAQMVGCADFSPESKKWDIKKIVEKIIKCLRSKSADEISATQPIHETDGYQFRFIARDSGSDAVAPGTYDELLQQTLPIPVLTGTLSKEFLFSNEIIQTSDDGESFVNQSLLHLWSTRTLGNAFYMNPKRETIEATMKEYNSIPRARYTYDDTEIYIPTHTYAVNQFNRGSDTYLYEFVYEYIGDAYDSGPKKIPTSESPKHAQELAYLLGQHVGNFTAKDFQIRYLHSQIFVDFINHGTPVSPTRKWDKFNPKDNNYFVIDFPDPDLKFPGMKNGYHSKAVKFWNLVVPKLEGPKTNMVSEEQFGYDPHLAKSFRKVQYAKIADKTGPDPINVLSNNLLLLANSKQSEANQEWYFSGSLLSWIIVTVVFLLVLSQIWTCYMLKSHRQQYQKL